jgi:putative transposase
MFNQLIAGMPTVPQQLSNDHDPLFQFHRWKADLRILEVSEIKTVPHVPLSHPFVERAIGTVRRELLDQFPFWEQISNASCGTSVITPITREFMRH